MDKELYLIHLDDYLDHIDGKLEMYDLLLEMVRTLRQDLAEGETAQAVRTLCAYEQQAHSLFEGWGIPDEYVESCDPDDLAQLMEDELLPAGDGEDCGNADEGVLVSSRLLRVADLLIRASHKVLNLSREVGDIEGDFLDYVEGLEKPENDCAG